MLYEVITVKELCGIGKNVERQLANLTAATAHHERFNRLFSEGSFTVITSYSIHYTKLYECRAGGRRR